MLSDEQRELRYVVNRYTAAHGGEYDLTFRRCSIQFESFLPDILPPSDDPEYAWWVAVIASVMVHEASHGRIKRHRIRTNTGPKENWERIEQLCCKQEQYFAERVPSRFRRVQRELLCIANQYTSGRGAEYCLVLRQCLIDFEALLPDLPSPDEPAYRWYVARVASTLVHEATHGRVYRYHIPYRNDPNGNWERIERLCRKQEQYFAERITDTTYDYAGSLVSPLDVHWYRTHFGKSGFERLREFNSYLRETWQK